MSERDALKAMIEKNINLGGFLADGIDLLLEPSLKRIVASTENTFDDMAMATIYPLLSKEIKAMANEKLNEIILGAFEKEEEAVQE